MLFIYSVSKTLYVFVCMTDKHNFTFSVHPILVHLLKHSVD